MDKVFTEVFSKYANFVDVISSKLAIELLKHISINNYVIKLVHDQELPYSSIYSLSLMKLETLKTYINNNLVNGFIRSSKSIVGAFIYFDKKLDKS